MILLIQIISDVILFAYAIWFASSVYSSIKTPPFIRTRKPVTVEVVKLFGNLPAGNVYYELGSGDGRVLSAIAKANPETKCIGIEKHYVPLFLAHWRQLFDRLPNVSYVRKDLYKTDLSAATHIYTYLYGNVMNDLLPKFEKELKPGTKLISLDFVFDNKTPTETYKIPNRYKKWHLGKELYTYVF